MSTKRRIQSSRANGAKPSTNSLSHDLLSKLAVPDGEFTELRDRLLAEFKPQTPAQRLLVENMAAARWRVLRIWSIERDTMQAEIDKYDGRKYPAATRAALAFRNLADHSHTLDLLHYYELRFDRQFTRSLNRLLELSVPPSGAGRPARASADGATPLSKATAPRPTGHTGKSHPKP